MPKTLLAVDDSATMRKVLEITFAGEDFRVVSSEGAAGALAKLGEEPAAVVIDTSLAGEDGYALAKDVRARHARAAVLLMASRYNPYDAARGRDAGVDDNIDKPFDTQALIDKVKKAIAARESARQAAPPPVAAAPPPQASSPTAPSMTASFGSAPRTGTPAAAAPGSSASGPAAPKTWGTARTHTLAFGDAGAPAPAPPAAGIAPPLSRTAPSGITPLATPPSPGPAPAPAIVAPVGATTNLPTAAPPAHSLPTAAPPRTFDSIGSGASSLNNGQLAGKLDELGLTRAQVEAVLALSRELVERVVWEVVPPLAETMIKEEIARLTRDD